MQLKLLTATIALALLMCLGACGIDRNDEADPNPEDSSASYKSELERNGVHDGNSANWDGTNQFTQDKQNNAQGNQSMGDDLQNAAEKARNGIDKTTRDLTDAAKDAGRDLNQGARDLTNGTNSAAPNMKDQAQNIK